jgi:DNA-binding transcriptional MerR regulator
MSKLISISAASKILNLIDPSTKKPLNHTLRYWEKEFKEIKPKKINNRRYYTMQQIELIKMIKFLLKNRGMTISGVKSIMNSNTNKLDVHDSLSLKTQYYKDSFKKKSKLILEKINKLKSYGKKNAS